MDKILVKNICKCLVCGTILPSAHRHDFKQCSCENATFNDGGLDYIRRGGKDTEMIEDMSEYRDPTDEEMRAEAKTLPIGSTLLGADQQGNYILNKGMDAAICGCGKKVRYITLFGFACNKHHRCKLKGDDIYISFCSFDERETALVAIWGDIGDAYGYPSTRHNAEVMKKVRQRFKTDVESLKVRTKRWAMERLIPMDKDVVMSDEEKWNL